jgi:hypothetical protein
METKLEKSCKPNELQVGNRYCMSSYHIVPKFIFIVSRIDSDGCIRICYLDDIHGLVRIHDDRTFYEFPYSSLEKELL